MRVGACLRGRAAAGVLQRAWRGAHAPLQALQQRCHVVQQGLRDLQRAGLGHPCKRAKHERTASAQRQLPMARPARPQTSCPAPTEPALAMGRQCGVAQAARGGRGPRGRGCRACVSPAQRGDPPSEDAPVRVALRDAVEGKEEGNGRTQLHSCPTVGCHAAAKLPALAASGKWPQHLLCRCKCTTHARGLARKRPAAPALLQRSRGFLQCSCTCTVQRD